MRERTLLISILLFCAVLWVYWPSTLASFQFDDALFLEDDNVTLARWEAFVQPPASRLLAWLSLVVQYQIHGPDPVPFHLFNLLLHGLNGVLAFLLLNALVTLKEDENSPTGVALAIFGGLVFALHPLQTEAVIYVYQRSTLLAACFSFLTLLAYVRKRAVLTLVFMLLAFLSKEFTVVLPLVLWSMSGLLHDEWKPSRWLGLYGGIALCTGLGFLVAFLPAADTLWECTIYALTQVGVVFSYISLTLLPRSLNLDHHVSAEWLLFDPAWWLALALLALLFWLLVRLRNRSPAIVFFALLYFAFLLPTSSFVPSQDYMFEHRVYTSLLGFAGLLTLGAGGLWRSLKTRTRSWNSQARTASLVLLIAVLSGVTLTYVIANRERQQVWSSEIALWSDTAAKSPHKYRPNYNLGVVLMERLPQTAIHHLTRAIGIDPEVPLAYRSLGAVYFARGDLNAAEHVWQQALALAPDHMETHLALGRLHAEKGDFFLARQHFGRCQELAPGDWRSYFHLAQLLLRFGFVEPSIIQSQMGLDRNPDQIDLLLLLADSMAQTENWSRAVELYQEAITRDPDNSQTYYQLAQVYWAAGQSQSALDTLQKGVAAADSQTDLDQGRLLLDRLAPESPEPGLEMRAPL